MSRLLVSALTLAFMCVCAVSAHAETIRYHGSSTVLRGIMYKASAEFKELEGVDFDLKGKSTGVGIEKIIAGECDIAGGGRPLGPSEKAAGLVETPLFLDAYAIIVHPHNPLQEITTSQLSRILNGNVTSWKDIVDFDSSIKLFSPPSGAAQYTNFQREFGFTALPRYASQVKTAPDVYYNVREGSGSVGWLSYSTVWQKPDVKILAINKGGSTIKLNEDNVHSGAYPYVSMEYFYTKGQPTGVLKKFIDFIKSQAGEKIILGSGFFMPSPGVVPAEGY